jgi:hypothetical protein
MPTLLERSIRSVDQRLVLLAPPKATIPPFFERLDASYERHWDLLREVQRLRGHVYLNDGALAPEQLSPEGLHQTQEDHKSWHLLVVDKRQRITACLWYLQHENTTQFDNLRVRHCGLAHVQDRHASLRTGVESELLRARRERLHYAEIGGWAVSSEGRHTSQGLLLALATFSLGRVFGGALGITTATVRHCSSTILRRLGGSHLEVDGSTVAPYYDPHYDCEMELLRFDSRRPNADFEGAIQLLGEMLPRVAVVGGRRADVAASERLRPATGLPRESFAA